MIVCGVDPGFSGAVGFIQELGHGQYNVFAYDMPVVSAKKPELDLPKLVSYFRACDYIFLEKAGPMPKQGISSTFRYAAGWGMIQGICAALERPLTLVHPVTWKKAMMNYMGREKEAAILRAKQFFPGVDFHRKKDHGRAEALLIGMYGLRQIQGRLDGC